MTDSLIGSLIDGRYQVRSRIARGGMATVYLATDLRLERKVAIKVMHGHLSDDAKFRERFIQEARSAARLAHPNVVNVFDQGQDSDMAYLVMEYLPGITLRDLLEEHGRLTTDQTLDILEAVLAGLSAAHKAGIVHRDLKPENVLLADDGRIKIGDFGLARAASANTATGAALLGTIAYLSPELVTRGIADTRSDIYAVGIMTYEMVTGVQPFVGEQPMQVAYQHANDTVPAPSDRNPRVPAEIDDLVLWSTARNPEDRPRDARTLLNDVIAVRSALDAAGSATSPQRTVAFPAAAPMDTLTPAPTGDTAYVASVAAAAPQGDTSDTVVIAPARRRTPAAADAVSDLADGSTRRRGRARWILALVVVLAVLAGGTGWYFGLGPGSRSTVPNLSRDSLTAARAALKHAGLVPLATTTTRSDPDVNKGAVSGTSPGVGSSLAKGTRVTIILSNGPAEIVLPSLTGLTEASAKNSIRAAGFLVGNPTIRQFDPTIDKGVVVDYLGTDGKSLIAQSRYSQKRAITLVVSAGSLPTVSGLTLSAAETALRNVGLTPAPGVTAYSSTVPLGDVIGIDPQKSAGGVPRVFRVGDTAHPALLITSKGPQMVTVPNVIDMTWAKAKALLSPDFTLVYDTNADAAPNFVTITAVSPGVGSSVARKSKLTITFNFQ
jgi:beta-lactam-binding protein with PASTA domain/tRNA A-37 threonylcarbamoyl transferase component Bud32